MCCRRRDEDKEEQIPWIHTWAADVLFGVLIVVSAILLGVDIELSLQGIEDGDVIFWVQLGFLVMFVLELILRVCAEGCSYFLFFSNLLDTFIIGCSVAEYVVIAFMGGAAEEISALSLIRIFRLLRILRVVRLVRVCPKLYRICTSLVAAVRAVSWVFLLLFVFMYISALSCTVLLSNSKHPLVREHFGAVFPSLYIHFVILTVEGFPELVAAIAEENGWLWYIYFCCYILFTNVMVMNTVTGVICQTVVSQGAQDAGARQQTFKEFEKLKEVVLDCMLLEGLRYDVHDEMSFEVFQQVMRSPGVRASFDAVEVCLDLEEDQLFNILDENGDGRISFDEFFISLWRLRGSKERLHSLLVQSDIVSTHKRMIDRVAKMSEDLQLCHSRQCEQFQDVLVQRCRAMATNLEERSRQQRHQQQDEPAELAKQQLSQLLESTRSATTTAQETLQRLQQEIAVKRPRVAELKAQLQQMIASKEILETKTQVLKSTGSSTSSTSKGDAEVQVAQSPPSPTSSEAQSPVSQRRERMGSQRRLKEMHERLTPKESSFKEKKPNPKLLRTFHGHGHANRQVAKAATATSSESEAEAKDVT